MIKSTFFTDLLIHFYFMRMFVFCIPSVCTYSIWVRKYPWRIKEGIRSSGTGFRQLWAVQCEYYEEKGENADLLKDQYALLTVSHLSISSPSWADLWMNSYIIFLFIPVFLLHFLLLFHKFTKSEFLCSNDLSYSV